MKKFELTSNTRVIDGITLYQIKYLVDIRQGNIKAGDLGGWLENEASLSHEGKCFVLGDAIVFRDAKIQDNAHIYGGWFHSGNFYGGTFRGGYFHGGYFFKGWFHGGQFSGGEYYGGNFFRGLFFGGKFFGGTFHSGIFRGGEFHEGWFHGGEFHDGWFHGGEFRSGEFNSKNITISSNKDFMIVSSIGKRDVELLIAKTSDGLGYVNHWYFSGTLQEFVDKVKELYKEGGENFTTKEEAENHIADFMAIVEIAKRRLRLGKQSHGR